MMINDQPAAGQVSVAAALRANETVVSIPSIPKTR